MALTKTEKEEIEVIVRKELRSFLDSNTLQQFEKKMIDKMVDEIKKGNVRGDIAELMTKVMTEFYRIMWSRRSFWEPSLKRVK
jgi:uncharacterized protein YaaW (UPF0174 family)